mmetsp:Transcript_50171/g.121561  ORF Transcript_50171/g.121561 Transcript_50171/m.121561 type:complete len:451 (-) Transcript_50171:775-2127(-)
MNKEKMDKGSCTNMTATTASSSMSLSSSIQGPGTTISDVNNTAAADATATATTSKTMIDDVKGTPKMEPTSTTAPSAVCPHQTKRRQEQQQKEQQQQQQPQHQTRRTSALDEDESYPRTFQEEMNEIMEAFYSMVSEEDMHAYQSFIEDISQKKVAEGAVDVGEVAPDFELQDQDGETVHLQELVQQGPVVVIFYRGKWCPHCNATIMALSASYDKIQAKGASLVAISPMMPDGTQFLATKRCLLFPVCSDFGNDVTRKYHITFEVQAEIRSKMVEWGEDVPGHNGDESWVIPLPAAYIIGEDGRVVWNFIDNDPGVRASPDQIIDAIPQSTKSPPSPPPTPVKVPSKVGDYGDRDGDDCSLLTTDALLGHNSWSNGSKGSRRGGRSRSFNRRHLSSTFKNCKAHVRRVFGRKKQPAEEFISEFMLPPPDERTTDLSSQFDHVSIKSSPY